jgi:DNA-directed RNA polymerase specialized sigma24 family protein
MSKWANKNIRQQREAIIIEKHLNGWRVGDIANYIGIPPGSVSNVIKIYLSRERINEKDVSATQE